MAGLLLNLVPKRLFDFGGLQVGATQSFVFAEQINILEYCDGVLITRVHSVSLSSGNIQVQLRPDGHTDEDSLIFAGHSPGYFIFPALLDSSTTAGTLVAMGNDVGEFHGEYAQLVVSATKLINAPFLSAVLSVDLLLRSPEDVEGLVPRAVARAGGCGCD